jgi:hypothetical protein
MKTFENYIVVGKPVYVNKEGSIKHAVEGLINGISIWLAPTDDLQPVTKELTADLYMEALKFLKDKNIDSLVDRGYIARWMTDFATQLKETLPAQQSEKERQVYHLNCDKCGKTFWSQEAFPNPQVCFNCIQQKEPLPRQMIRDIAVIYENYLQEWHLTDRDIVLLHALYAKIYDYIDQKQK